MSVQVHVHRLALRAFEDLKVSLLYPPGRVPIVDWRVSRLRQFIDEKNGCIGYRLADVCRQLDLGVSASHASRLFHQDQGFAIREYMKLKRLQTAAVKLQTTSMSVKEIAAELGYQTPADLFRQFKGFFQVTPLTFRSISRTHPAFNQIVP